MKSRVATKKDCLQPSGALLPLHAGAMTASPERVARRTKCISGVRYRTIDYCQHHGTQPQGLDCRHCMTRYGKAHWVAVESYTLLSKETDSVKTKPERKQAANTTTHGHSVLKQDKLSDTTVIWPTSLILHGACSSILARQSS